MAESDRPWAPFIAPERGFFVPEVNANQAKNSRVFTLTPNIKGPAMCGPSDPQLIALRGFQTPEDVHGRSETGLPGCIA
jgi:hypothetical protein